MKHFVACKIDVVFFNTGPCVDISIPFYQVENAILCLNALLLNKTDHFCLKTEGPNAPAQFSIAFVQKGKQDKRNKTIKMTPHNIRDFTTEMMADVVWLESLRAFLTETWVNNGHSCSHMDMEFFSKEGQLVDVAFRIDPF